MPVVALGMGRAGENGRCGKANHRDLHAFLLDVTAMAATAGSSTLRI
jgi:hypothetical protein